MKASILPDGDIAPLDRLLIVNGLVRPVPVAALDPFPHTLVQLWCVRRGAYQVPTTELVQWLRAFNPSLEVCAGLGPIGRALGIRMTDSHMHIQPEMLVYYKSLGQEPTVPPADVEEIDAIRAVVKYRPKVVIAAWATQLYKNDSGSMYGVDEEAILDAGVTYIHVGNDGPHGQKRIDRRPHTVYRFPWLVTRTTDQDANHIKVWRP